MQFPWIPSFIHGYHRPLTGTRETFEKSFVLLIITHRKKQAYLYFAPNNLKLDRCQKGEFLYIYEYSYSTLTENILFPPCIFRIFE